MQANASGIIDILSQIVSAPQAAPAMMPKAKASAL
jgi:hypothetical protein